MMLTPILSAQTARLYSLKKRWFQKEPLESINFPDKGFQHHVVIAGGGRVGTADRGHPPPAGHPFVVIELDQRRIEQAKMPAMPSSMVTPAMRSCSKRPRWPMQPCWW
jgi:monovalent cation:H+ antiporter-2, CPA2 family